MAKKTNNRIIIDIAKKYIALLEQNNMRIKKVYLFGSSVNGNLNKNSDIDLAVVSDGFKGDIIDDQLLLMRYRRSIDLRIEPHPFLSEEFKKTEPFVNEIMKKGIRIK